MEIKVAVTEEASYTKLHRSKSQPYHRSSSSHSKRKQLQRKWECLENALGSRRSSCSNLVGRTQW